MAAPDRTGEYAIPAHAFDEPEARSIAAVPHDCATTVAYDVRLAVARHLAQLDLLDVGFALREPVGRAALHIGKNKQPGDAVGLFRVQAGSKEQRCCEAPELFVRQTNPVLRPAPIIVQLELDRHATSLGPFRTCLGDRLPAYSELPGGQTGR